MSNPHPPVRVIQFIFVASLAPALVGSLLLSLLWLSYSPLLFGLMLVTMGGHYLLGALGRAGKPTEWVLSLAVLNLLVLTPEVYLRLTQFHYETGIQFAFPRSFQRFTPDKDLFWTFPVGEEGVNSFGFQEKEITIPKPANVCRLLFLGDSVPGQGYPAIVAEVLNKQALAQPVESISMALAGYSTYQGRVLVDKYGALVEPDVVIVSYGWNDHWLAYGAIDSQKVVNTQPSLVQRAYTGLYNNSRLLQWLRFMLRPVLGREVPLPQVRVPLEEYTANITHIGQFFEERDVPVVFITPPSAHYQLGVPDYLVDDGFAVDKESVTTLHRAYNQALRDVGTAHGWLILELEQEFESASNLPEIFISDGIHLTDAGLQRIGQQIADFIVGRSCLK